MKLEELLNNIPSREELATMLRRQAGYAAGWDTFSTLGILSVGMLLGAGLALAFAPKPGHELRQDVAEKFGRASGQASRKLSDWEESSTGAGMANR